MKSPTGLERAAKFRKKMRAAGFKETTIWLPKHRVDEVRIFAHVLRIHPDAPLTATLTVPPCD
jgi:hypothetical protein